MRRAAPLSLALALAAGSAPGGAGAGGAPGRGADMGDGGAPSRIADDASEDASVLALQGDPEYGVYLSGECTTCHRRDGADDGIPGVTGWPAEDFIAAMLAYRRKTRPNPVMQMIAGRLSDEEIAALASYFKTLD